MAKRERGKVLVAAAGLLAELLAGGEERRAAADRAEAIRACHACSEAGCRRDRRDACLDCVEVEATGRLAADGDD